MLRSNQILLPTHNRLLQSRWDDTKYNEHKRKVREATTKVDTRPPPTYPHIDLKLKKRQIENDRHSIVERDNQIHSGNLSYIRRSNGLVDKGPLHERRKSESQLPVPPRQRRPSTDSKSRTRSMSQGQIEPHRPTSSLGARRPSSQDVRVHRLATATFGGSLSYDRRKREQAHVDRENDALRKRILARKSSYQKIDFDREWVEKLGYMVNIATYPPSWSYQKRRGSVAKSQPNARDVQEPGDQQQETERQERETEG